MGRIVSSLMGFEWFSDPQLLCGSLENSSISWLGDLIAKTDLVVTVWAEPSQVLRVPIISLINLDLLSSLPILASGTQVWATAEDTTQKVGFLFDQLDASFFANFSFLFLFLALVFYWLDLVFLDLTSMKSTQTAAQTTTEGVASLSNSGKGGNSNPVFLLDQRYGFGTYCLVLANICLIILLSVRWKESGHFPLSNLYESLMFLSWSCTSIHLFLISTLRDTQTIQPRLAGLTTSSQRNVLGGFSEQTKLATPFAPNIPNNLQEQNNLALTDMDNSQSGSIALQQNINTLISSPSTKPIQFLSESAVSANAAQKTDTPSGGTAGVNLFLNKLLGAVLAPLALFLNAFATFSLPAEMQSAGPLVPALQSNWLMMHVTVMIISYAALILGSLLSIVFVIALNVNKVLAGFMSKSSKVFATLDYLSYRIIGIGFPFLTIGILSGAVWANEAWGSYWSWDPKETWALLTWLIFAIYLHTRLTKGWEGEKPALIASFGFIVVWICYLGVNLLGEGLHSYGFF